MKTTLLSLTLVAASVSGQAFASVAPLASNAVIVDNAPFYSVTGSDVIGSGNYALNHPGFIDIPYAIFDFGSTSSVSSATLTWNYGSPYYSGPAQISLYVGSDADGVISTSDRFMGTLVDTFTYAGGELRSHNLTSFVNSALGSGQYFAARLEVTTAPGQLTGYLGGQFQTPSMQFVAGTVPEPETYAMLVAGLGLLGFVARRKKQA